MEEVGRETQKARDKKRFSEMQEADRWLSSYAADLADLGGAGKEIATALGLLPAIKSPDEIKAIQREARKRQKEAAARRSKKEELKQQIHAAQQEKEDIAAAVRARRREAALSSALKASEQARANPIVSQKKVPPKKEPELPPKIIKSRSQKTSVRQDDYSDEFDESADSISPSKAATTATTAKRTPRDLATTVKKKSTVSPTESPKTYKTHKSGSQAKPTPKKSVAKTKSSGYSDDPDADLNLDLDNDAIYS